MKIIINQKNSCMAFLLPVTLALFLISSCGRDSSPEDSDVTPPAEVVNLNGIAGNARVTLTWTDPADNDFNKVEIARAPGNVTVEVGKGAQTAVIGNLANGTAYSFTLKTADISGNKSAGINAGPYTPEPSTAPPVFPQELETIPAAYNAPATQQGTLVELYYDTYESRTYAQKTRQLRKRAIVYLPHGYDKNLKYKVFYLMHGGWGNETSTLGTPQRHESFLLLQLYREAFRCIRL